MKRVGLLLCGCGVYDGSEAQETVLLLLALERRGLRPIPMAPDVLQRDVADHATGETIDGAPARHVLSEAARLTRGSIRPLSEVLPAELHALVVPGGIGVVKNLCLPGDGALGAGPLRPEVMELLGALAARRVPIAVCGLARILFDRMDGAPIDPGAMQLGVLDLVVDDEKARLFTPGFLASDALAEVAKGIERLVEELSGRLGPAGLVGIGGLRR